MNELDWGSVTPEASNVENNTFTYVFNHKLSSTAEIDRTIRFVVGRLQFYDNHLPANPRHDVRVDARGQSIDRNAVTLIVKKIREMYNKPYLQEVKVIQ